MSLPTIPGYELTDLVGRGGAGRVYRAIDLRLGRTVAIKMLIDADDPELVRRFEVEANTIANLSHPNIARLFEFGQTESGKPYCVMEFVAGGTLADAIARRPISATPTAQILLTLARAIEIAHRKGIIHRDLKPANILLAAEDNNVLVTRSAAAEEDTTVSASSPSMATPSAEIRSENLRISDFGLARRISVDSDVTKTGQVLGTPAYMAPEQASGMVMRPGPGVDIYALGAILYELLTGRPPFLGTDYVETIMLLLAEEPVRPRTLQPTIPTDLETICLKCLEKKPSRRYRSADELADDLTRFLENRPILAKPVSRTERVAKWAHRNPWQAFALSVVAVSAAALVVGLVVLQSAYHATTLANQELSMANQRLTTANDQIRHARDLTKESLDRIVNRVRDRLYDVPHTTAVLVETSHDSVELHRRLFQLQTGDQDAARRYIDALYNHLLLGWHHGQSIEHQPIRDELTSQLSELIRKHPDDLKFRLIHLKLALDDIDETQRKQPDPRRIDQDLLEVRRLLDELTKANPAEPELFKIASLLAQQRMNAEFQANNMGAYLATGRERVEASRRYWQLETDASRKIDAAIWFSQAQRILAQGLLMSSDAVAAKTELAEAMQRLQPAQTSSSSRTLRYELAQILFETARCDEKLGQTQPARDDYSQALVLYQELVADFPDDVRYRSQLTVALIRSAALANLVGEFDLALQQLETAQSQVEEMLVLSPDDPEHRALKQAITGFKEQIWNRDK